MFSGGLDSTAMLVKLLAESDDELRVHHIRMVNREGRDRAERRAVEAILAYCRARYRPFRYSESGARFPALEAIPIDYLSIAFVACQVAIDTPGCTRIAVGSLAADTDIANRSARQRRVFDDDVRVLSRAQARRAAGRVDLSGLRHAQGRALLQRCRRSSSSLTWSCRRPVDGGLRRLRRLQGLPRLRAGLAHPAEAAQNRASLRGGGRHEVAGGTTAAS